MFAESTHNREGLSSQDRQFSSNRSRGNVSYFDNLASKLLELDESIISATITSPIGEILSIGYIPSAETLKPSKELMDKSGSLVAIVSAMIGQAEAPYGDCLYTVIAYGKINVVIIPIKNKHIIIALGTTSDARTRHISLKVKELAEQ